MALSRRRSRTRFAEIERAKTEANQAQDRRTDDAAGRLLDYLDSELNAEAAFKSSLESRAFALITANLGIATLFVALATQFGRWTSLGQGDPQWWVFAALYLAAGSIVLGVVSALPMRVAAAAKGTERSLLTQLREGDDVDPISERLDIADLKIERLDTMRTGNVFRSRTILWSFVCFGGGAAALLTALLVI